MNAKGKLWVALDTDKKKSLEIMRKIGPAKLPVIRGVKLNRSLDQELFRRDGEPQLLREIADMGMEIWADIKIHDIPRTAAGRVEPYAQSGIVQYLTVMAKGGIKMMREAVKAGGEHLNIIAVTELTSLSEKEIDLGSGHSSQASVLNLSWQVVLAGVRYLVCSGLDLLVIREQPELNPLKPFVPGVNPSFASAGADQARTMTIVDALKQGADAVVVGGAIVSASDPVDVIKRITEEIEKEEAHRSGPPGYL